MTGCSWFLDLDGLAGEPQTTSPDAAAPRQNDARARIVPDQDAGGPQIVLDESWIDSPPSSNWYGPLRYRATSSPDGWCVDLDDDGSKWDGALEYDRLLTGQRIRTQLEYRYVVNAEIPLSNGATSVDIGILAIASNHNWAVSTRAIGGEDAGALIVDSRGLHGKATGVPRSTFSAPLRLELEATNDSLRGRLYAREGDDYVLRQAIDVVPSAELYDLSRGARARIGVSSFFGAQRVCITRVEISVEP